MKREKLSLKSIKNVLSRADLKKIMAGGSGCDGPGSYCGNCCSGQCGNLNGNPGGGGGYYGCL